MKFTIRDLLWLTVVVALGVGWWIDRSQQANRAALWESRATKMVGDFYIRGTKVIWDGDSIAFPNPPGEQEPSP